MADTANSTLAPSRRAFFGTAVAAGIGAAQFPILGEATDAALLALAPVVEALIARSNGLEREMLAAEEMIDDIAGPVPRSPRSEWFHTRRADYDADARRFGIEVDDRCRRVIAAEKEVGYAALTECCNAAYGEVVTARERLAAMKATTLAGVLAKARVAERAEWADLDRSVVADLVALGLSA